MEEAVVTSVEFPLQYTNVKFTFQNIGIITCSSFRAMGGERYPPPPSLPLSLSQVV